jgi:hypothetical protein
MGDKLWRFTGRLGGFESESACRIKALYFPLANERLMSSISPDLHGDIKTGQDSFLLTPASRIDLVNLRSSRNFWIRTDRGEAWSATGVSKDIDAMRRDRFRLRAGPLWHEITRANPDIGLEAVTLSFVPASGAPLEVMRVTISNISRRKIAFVPIAAIPIYGRGADNLRDHRHVTSLLQRPKAHRLGVMTRPTLAFDETGHRPNSRIYFVLGTCDAGARGASQARGPQYVYPTEEVFCGDGGDLEAPESVLKGILPPRGRVEGEEPMGGLRFRRVELEPGGKAFYTVLMGIAGSVPEMEAGGIRRPG